jgi:hypothetical protein
VLTLRDVRIGLRFARALPAFLRNPIDPRTARRAVAGRFARRADDFLRVCRESIYGNPLSPYRALLEHAGCTYGDLTSLVERDGVEGALRVLLRVGVYLTVDEFKGRVPVRRGSAHFAAHPAGIHDLRLRPHFGIRSSGSRGRQTPAAIDLDYVRERTVNSCLALEARGGQRWRHAVWGVPGSLFMVNLLEFAGFAARPVRWFSQLDPASPGIHPRYQWSARVLRAASVLSGAPLPAVRHVPLDDPSAIVHWMNDVRREGARPHLLTYASSAVRLSLAAQEAGLDLDGVKLSLTGEPLTSTRLAVLRASGAEAMPWYGAMESSSVGHACIAPAAPDDVHFLDDRLALVQAAADAGSSKLPAGALLLTSIRPRPLFTMLNVSLGDEAVVSTRRCGCPMEAYGWRTHLEHIRSYEKLTAAGMTFLDSDVIRVLDEVLPRRVGGAPTDYQLVEEEASGGRPCLTLRVHPRVGACDLAAVGDTFLRALGEGDGVARVMSSVWRDSRILRVERQAPLAGATGKILHLHVDRPVLA